MTKTDPRPPTTLRMRTIGGGRVCDLKPGMVVIGPRGGKHVIAEITGHADGTRTITSTTGWSMRKHYLADAEYGEFVEEPAPSWIEQDACRNCGRPIERNSLREGWFHPTYRTSPWCDATLTVPARPVGTLAEVTG
jgi:hypothetical protein